MRRGRILNLSIKRGYWNRIRPCCNFSPTYAKSRWCLDEFVLMLVVMLEMMTPIIPVFHGVNPTNVQHTRGEVVYTKSHIRFFGISLSPLLFPSLAYYTGTK